MPKFKTKQHGYGMRRHSWACRDCGSIYGHKVNQCGMCSSEQIQYFASNKELKRYQTLRLLQKLGVITKLELQPVYPICINKKKICDYRADFSYIENGQLVVEDVKGDPSGENIDAVFKLKKKLVEAIYGIEITLISS